MIDIHVGLILAILDNKLSFKEKGEKYFSSNWEDSSQAAERVFNKRLEDINKDYITREEQVYYPAIDRYRREVVVVERINKEK